MSQEENLTYQQAVTELDSILRTIQGADCDIDKLSQLTRRATVLLDTCRARLTATETELREILTSLKQ